MISIWPVVVASMSATAVPSAFTGALTVVSPLLNSTVPAAPAGETVAVARTESPGMTSSWSTVSTVWVASAVTSTDFVSVLVVYRSGSAGWNVAVTVSSPAVAAVNSAVAVPSSVTGTRMVSSPAANSASPSAPAGVTVAVAWTVPPAVTVSGSRVRSVAVVSESTEMVVCPELGR